MQNNPSAHIYSLRYSLPALRNFEGVEIGTVTLYCIDKHGVAQAVSVLGSKNPLLEFLKRTKVVTTFGDMPKIVTVRATVEL